MIEPPSDSVHPKTRAKWRSWLLENHTRPEGVWLIGYKRATGKPRVEYEEAVKKALCFGWIDSKANKLDDERSMLWMSPRKPRTGWSKPNKERLERLIAAGMMMAVGLALVETAKRDGSWNALDSVEALEIPSDLAKGAGVERGGPATFRAFPRSVKRGILEWILNAKKARDASQTDRRDRAAAENVRANQWRS